MRKRLFLSIACAVVAFAQSAATDPAGGGTALAAVAKQTAPKGPTPRTADGKPDFSGIWSPERTFIYDISSSLAKGETLPLQPWAEKLAKELDFLKTVNAEDIAVNEMQQLGAATPSVEAGRLSVLEKAVWQLADYVRGRVE